MRGRTRLFCIAASLLLSCFSYTDNGLAAWALKGEAQVDEGVTYDVPPPVTAPTPRKDVKSESVNPPQTHATKPPRLQSVTDTTEPKPKLAKAAEVPTKAQTTSLTGNNRGKTFSGYLGVGGLSADRGYFDVQAGVKFEAFKRDGYLPYLMSHLTLINTGINVSETDSSRYRQECFSNGNCVCRDTTNGQFAKKELCGGDYNFNTVFASSADVEISVKGIYAGVGYRLFDNTGMFYTIGYSGDKSGLKFDFNKDLFSGALIGYF
jgi:CRISPR/Cas system-associated protein endoribonuclease Cas2